jgi:CubicO group peptidase (beta-lactamase class C family)
MAEGSDGAMYGSPHAWSLAHPAFGVVATVNDLLRFGMAFLEDTAQANRFLSRATRHAMRIDQTGGRALGNHPAAPSSEPVPIPWGLGFYIQSPSTPGVYGDLAPFGTFGHGGASGCQWAIDPINNIVVAVVSNLHARSGREAWSHRLRSTLNMAWTAV